MTAKPAPDRPDFERIALLLQGGDALGSYQAGVYESLAEADPAGAASPHLPSLDITSDLQHQMLNQWRAMAARRRSRHETSRRPQ